MGSKIENLAILLNSYFLKCKKTSISKLRSHDIIWCDFNHTLLMLHAIFRMQGGTSVRVATSSDRVCY